jgi:hypothetical protein
MLLFLGRRRGMGAMDGTATVIAAGLDQVGPD